MIGHQHYYRTPIGKSGLSTVSCAGSNTEINLSPTLSNCFYETITIAILVLSIHTKIKTSGFMGKWGPLFLRFFEWSPLSKNAQQLWIQDWLSRVHIRSRLFYNCLIPTDEIKSQKIENKQYKLCASEIKTKINSPDWYNFK